MDELAKEVRQFLEDHARIDVRYDPEWDEPQDRWSSPDASELDYAASEMEAGRIPDYPRSSWESGGYEPYEDKEAKAWHDDLLQRITNLHTRRTQ